VTVSEWNSDFRCADNFNDGETLRHCLQLVPPAIPGCDVRRFMEFPDGEVTEFTANVIAESMIAQCDAKW